jgi:hypothetical protein
MHDESNGIVKLLHVGRAATHDKFQASNGLVLWCRTYDQDKRTFSPYSCLGRLTYHSHEAGSRPLKFIWTLQDYDDLTHHANTEMRERFQQMVDSYS